MNIIEWEDELFLLDVEVMDETHREFVDLVNQLNNATNKEFPTLFDQLIAHTQTHFRQEENFMMESKFPSIAEHKDEHQRILGEMHQFKKRVDKGLIAFGRNYIKSRMPEWFRLHAATMDSALAMHLKKSIT